MINLFEKLLNLIYIQPCYFCKSSKEDTLLCSKCYSKIRFLPIKTTRIIQNCKIYACTYYENIIKTLVKDLKYYKKKKLAIIQAKIMYEYLQKLDLSDNYIIVPVPIHSKRLKERKYNHMDLVADELSKLTNFDVNKKFLIRTKDTLKQFNLHKNERVKNIRGAFNINKEESLAKDSKILIIDDIVATGTTLDEIIKSLKGNGYINITALTLATPELN